MTEQEALVKALSMHHSPQMKSPKQFFVEKFEELPSTDAEKLMIVMMREYADYCLKCDRGEQSNIADVMAMLPTESQLDEIAFKKYGNDPEGGIKFQLIKRMAFVEGCEFMLRLLKGN